MVAAPVEITTAVLTGIGSPRALFSTPAGVKLLASDTASGSEHRAALYSENNELLATCSGLNFQINDVAFHPNEPLIALATGSYDGGYSFEGELLLWNWQTSTRRVVYSGCAVLNVDFDTDNSIECHISPPTDWDDDLSEEDPDAWSRSYRFLLALDPLTQETRSLGEPKLDESDPGYNAVEELDLNGRADALRFVSAELGGEPDRVGENICWLGDTHVALAIPGYIELWSLTGKRIFQARCGGNSTELRKLDDEAIFVNAVRYTDHGPAMSNCFVLTTAGLEKVTLPTDRAVSLEKGPTGQLVVAEYSWTQNSQRSWEFVHDSLSWKLLSDEPVEYFVSPISDGTRHWLQQCQLSDRTISTFHDWNSNQCRVFSDSKDPASEWLRTFVGQPIELAAEESSKIVAIAFGSGKFALLSRNDGTTMYEQDVVERDGMKCFVSALAVNEQRVVASTTDGRILLWDLANQQ